MRRRKRWRRVFSLFLALVLILICLCWYFGIRSHIDLIAYAGMWEECHPIWKDLAFQRIHAGQSLDEVMALAAPSRVERHDPYTTISYFSGGIGLHFTGISLVAKDNHVVSAEAWSCCWNHTFFDRLSRQERLDYWDSYKSYLEDQARKRPQKPEEAAEEKIDDGKPSGQTHRLMSGSEK